MSNALMDNSVEMYCQLCGGSHLFNKKSRKSQALVKNEAVEYEQIYFECDSHDHSGNEFYPAEIMDENLSRARDAYRLKHGLLTSKDIREYRKKYALSQLELARLLGWGDVTITRYETKYIQGETYDRLLRLIFENQLFALEMLRKHRAAFDEKRYLEIYSHIREIAENKGLIYLKKQEIIIKYLRYNQKAICNGYKMLDLDKVSSVMAFFAHHADNLYKVKLMKLLWYADVLHFKRHGEAITGLVYRRMPLGALPIGYEEIMALPAIRVVEDYINGDISYRVCSNGHLNLAELSLSEVEVLTDVVKKFKSIRAKDIINYMHQEPAYSETGDGEIISFSFARQLRELA